MRALALGDFIFVMRELQVGPTTVDVKSLAQHLAAHGRALNVPAGAARPVHAVPLRIWRLGRFSGLPQHEVQRVVFAVQHRHPLTRMQFVK